MGGEERHTAADLARAKDIDKKILARPWWEMVIGGILIMVMGIIAMVYPDITIGIIILLFGAILLVEGIFLIIGSFAVKAEDPMWVMLLIGGIISLIIGAAILAWPDITAKLVLWLFAIWAIVVGMINLVWAVKTRKDADVAGKPAHAVFGIIGITFGIIAFAWPEATIMSIVWIVGLFATLMGILLMIAGFMARKKQQI